MLTDNRNNKVKELEAEIEQLKKELDESTKSGYSKDEKIKEWKQKYEVLEGKYKLLRELKGLKGEE